MTTRRSAPPAYQHPAVRLMTHGAQSLSTAELLAILLHTGTATETALPLAERILALHNGLPGLSNVSAADLLDIPGLGSVRSTQIVASLELGRRLANAGSPVRPFILTAADAAAHVSDLAAQPQENVRLILLDTARRVIASPTVYIGTITLTVLRISEVYRQAVAHNAPAVILAHNHPSGDPTPSPADVELTRALLTAGELLDISFVDHIIVGRGSWVSLREQGFLT